MFLEIGSEDSLAGTEALHASGLDMLRLVALSEFAVVVVDDVGVGVVVVGVVDFDFGVVGCVVVVVAVVVRCLIGTVSLFVVHTLLGASSVVTFELPSQ